MKYKNYINSYTKDNRIFSKEDISNMTVRDAYGNKRAIIAQNRKIGVPSDAELRNSSNVIWINPYKRDDGTPVKGHWRSKSGTGGIAGDEPPVIMDEAVKHDSDMLNLDNQISQDEEELNGMGSTLVLAYLDREQWRIVNVGDSRAYLYDGNELRQITEE